MAYIGMNVMFITWVATNTAKVGGRDHVVFNVTCY